MSVWAIYQICSVAIDYAKYPKTITRSREEERVVEVPAVTVCNLSPLPATPALASHPTWGAFLALQNTASTTECDETQSDFDQITETTPTSEETNPINTRLSQRITQGQEKHSNPQARKIFGKLRESQPVYPSLNLFEESLHVAPKSEAEILQTSHLIMTHKDRRNKNQMVSHASSLRSRETQVTPQKYETRKVSPQLKPFNDKLESHWLRQQRLQDQQTLEQVRKYWKEGQHMNDLTHLEAINGKKGNQPDRRVNLEQYRQNQMENSLAIGKSQKKQSTIRMENMQHFENEIKGQMFRQKRIQIDDDTRERRRKFMLPALTNKVNVRTSMALLTSTNDPQDLISQINGTDSSLEVGEDGVGQCGSGYLPCRDNTCYREHLACNTWKDCQDATDEENCTCGIEQYRCKGEDPICISLSMQCDGVWQCPLGDDEHLCETCQAGTWQCAKGHQCIRDHLHCDLLVDCFDQSDEADCDVESIECAPEEIMCGEICIDRVFQCDGRQDCDDGSDEQFCDECKEGLFQCDKTCLPLHLRCDEEYHCSEGEDETNCTEPSDTCPTDHLTCYTWFSHFCLHPALVCDGRKDCSFGYDEEECGECGEGLFQCADNTCVPQHVRCDGEHHCSEGEDEKECGVCLGKSHHCGKENICIGVSNVCDGIKQCLDGSDEICGECPMNYSAACGDGHCLHNIYICDAHQDCLNGADERGCESCVKGRVLCDDGESCIYEHQVCDGENNCFNGTDEFGCDMTCREDYFSCSDYTCVHERFRCDGIDDCWDAADEMNCQECPKNVMKCDGGRCVDPSRRCDGYADCDGAQDERNCTGCKLGLLCEDLVSSYCVPLEKMCDGRADCGSGADEMLCEEYVEACPGLDFKCGDGKCVAARYRCDGETDCTAGDDEMNCESCTNGAYYCKDNKTCIADYRLCGGDCSLLMEEVNCTETVVCPMGLVQCGTPGMGLCVNPRFLCAEEWSSLPCPEDIRLRYCEDVTSLADVHNLRSQCSQFYQEVLRLQERSVSTSNQQNMCDNYTEDENWSIICQIGIFCDHYGCYDDNLRSYQESSPQAGIQCSKCGGSTDLCWPSRWMDDWREGRLEEATLKLMLLRQRADFADLQEVFSTPAADQRLYSLPPESLVYSCSLDNHPCDYRWFFAWPSDTHGMCYTFNAQHNDSLTLPRPDPVTAHVGPKNGLRLGLTVHPGLSLLSPEIGLRVVVHSPYHLPVPDEQGFNIGPGASSISVSRTVNRRLGKPHWSCREDSPTLPHYSTTVCRQVCVESEKRTRCGCGEGASPVHEELQPPPLGLCSRQNATQKLCMDLVQADYLSGVLQCDCPVACRETEYHTQVTSSQINDKYYDFLHQFRKPDISLCSRTAEMAVLHVYLDSTSYQLIEESPTYTWDTLLSNLGGSLGLFVGVSMVSIMEVLELFLDMVLLALRRSPRIKDQPTNGTMDSVANRRVSPLPSPLASTKTVLDVRNIKNIKCVSPYMSPSYSDSSNRLLESSVMSVNDNQLSKEKDAPFHGFPVHAAVMDADLEAVKKELENLRNFEQESSLEQQNQEEPFILSPRRAFNMLFMHHHT